MRSKVYVTVERPSVRLSVPSIDAAAMAGAFAAKYRLTAAGAGAAYQLQAPGSSNGAAARRSAANQPHIAAAVDRRNRQTDGSLDGHPSVT